MLKSLTIVGFKSIYHQKLEFGAINLFVGSNGAGKSNALEAIAILSAALSRGLDSISLDTKGIRLSLPQLFKSAFRNTGLKPHFRLEAEFEYGRYECSIRSNLNTSNLEFHSEAMYFGEEKVFGRGPNGVNLNRNFLDLPEKEISRFDPSRSVWDIVGLFSRVPDIFLDEIAQISEFAIYAPQTAVMRGAAVANRPVEPLGLSGSGLASAFDDLLNYYNTLRNGSKLQYEQIMSLIWEPGWANQIRVGSFDPSIVPSHIVSEGLELYIRDKYMKTNRNFLSTFDASEGTLYLVFIVSLLLHPETPKTFGLDNVDGTLNPALVRKLTSTLVAACTQDRDTGPTRAYQAFMTSHHPSALDSFDIFSDDQRIFVARRDEEAQARGSTVLERLEPPRDYSKDDWAELTDGRKLSVFLLEDKIPNALS